METRYFFAAILVLSGALCISAAAVSGAKLDSAYVAWSAARTPDTASAEDRGRPPHRLHQSALAGAPISILAPALIWSVFVCGIILALLGLGAGLRDIMRERTGQPDERVTA